MTLALALFILVALIAAGGALGVVLSRSIVHAAVWLLVALLGVSLLYFLLGAEFLGATQLIVYVGGTLVLMVFGVMLTNQGPFAGTKPLRMEWVIGGGVALLLFGILAKLSLSVGTAPPATDTELPSVGPLGMAFLGVPEPGERNAYLLPFEILSVHLLVVLIAAAYLARAKRKQMKNG